MSNLYSIIVPVYNVEKYLRECVDSILNQTYTNFEVILVDDGSTDDSPAICDEYAKSDKRVKVIHKENGGLVSARKTGIALATGDYVLNVDSDDYIDVNLLEDADKILAETKAEIFCFGYYKVFCNKKDEKALWFDTGFYDKSKLREKIYPNLMRNVNGKRIEPNLWSKIFKRSLLSPFQLTTNERIYIGEDESVSLPCLYFSKSIYITDRCYYYYRQNQSSMTKAKKGYPWTDIPNRVEVYKKYFPLNKYGFKEQLDRLIVHELFNVAKSHLRTSRPYKEVKKEIFEQFGKEEYKDAIKNCYFRKNVKENLALFTVRHRKIWLIRLYAKLS